MHLRVRMDVIFYFISSFYEYGCVLGPTYTVFTPDCVTEYNH